MSEYHHVEKTFLAQLAALGWTVIDQGQGVISSDPTASLLDTFHEWVFPEVFSDPVLGLPALTAAALYQLMQRRNPLALEQRIKMHVAPNTEIPVILLLNRLDVGVTPLPSKRPVFVPAANTAHSWCIFGHGYSP